MKESQLRREEVRGVFTIGVIATLFAADQLFGNLRVFDVPLAILTGFLLLFWLLYVLSMAVGVSDDIVGPDISERFQAFGRVCFSAGVGGTAVILISAPLFYLRDHGMVLQAQVGAILFLGLPAAYIIVRLFRKQPRKKHARKSD